MPQKNLQFGRFGASGIKGANAVARQLAGHIATPVTAKRGLTARLNYLTRSTKSLRAAREAGLTVTDRAPSRRGSRAAVPRRRRTWSASSTPTRRCADRTSHATCCSV